MRRRTGVENGWGTARDAVCFAWCGGGRIGVWCREPIPQGPFRTYATTTPALLDLRDWLICQGVTLVVMESTSAYWKPPFYLLEDDIACQVVNARDVKNVPGRPKTDLLTELQGIAAGQEAE